MMIEKAFFREPGNPGQMNNPFILSQFNRRDCHIYQTLFCKPLKKVMNV